MKGTKEQKGITLIALIITIVVLLILASVAISSISDDGILGYAKNSSENYKNAVKDEGSKLKDYTYIIGQYTEGTAENLGLKGELKVGDYIEYEYNENTYTVTKEKSGTVDYEVFNDDQTYDSANGAKITKWRVINIDESGRVDLLADLPSTENNYNTKLLLYGDKAYLNGPDILNDMCKSLYSGDYGEARCMTLQDILDITGLEINKLDTNTVNNLFENLEYKQLLGGKNKDDLDFYPSGEFGDKSRIDTISEQIANLFGIGNNNFYRGKWYLATPIVEFSSDNTYLKFCLAMVQKSVSTDNKASDTKVLRRHFYNAKEGNQNDVDDIYVTDNTKPTHGPTMVLPMVELKPGIKLQKTNDFNETTNRVWSIVK